MKDAQATEKEKEKGAQVTEKEKEKATWGHCQRYVCLLYRLSNRPDLKGWVPSPAHSLVGTKNVPLSACDASATVLILSGQYQFDGLGPESCSSLGYGKRLVTCDSLIIFYEIMCTHY